MAGRGGADRRVAAGDAYRVVGCSRQNDTDHTVTHTIGWVNAELMKNVAEIGQLRLMRGLFDGLPTDPARYGGERARTGEDH